MARITGLVAELVENKVPQEDITVSSLYEAQRVQLEKRLFKAGLERVLACHLQLFCTNWLNFNCYNSYTIILLIKAQER